MELHSLFRSGARVRRSSSDKEEAGNKVEKGKFLSFFPHKPSKFSDSNIIAVFGILTSIRSIKNRLIIILGKVPL